MKTLKKIGIAIGRFFVLLVTDTPEKVMIVDIDWDKNKIRCDNWTSEKIGCLSGEFTYELWEEVKTWCIRSGIGGGGNGTRIYIWKDGKRIAHCEPIRYYLDDEALLKTGQGYEGTSYNISKRREEVAKKKKDIEEGRAVECNNCGHTVPLSV